MEFVNDTGIKYFINAFKRWFINNINNWWKLLKVGHNYIDKGQWDYDVIVMENTDEETKKQYPLIPKITFNSTDWIYSKWNKTTSTAEFPIALIQDPEVQSNGRYESSYTGNITVNPAYGNINIKKSFITDKVSTTLNNTSILIANGTFKNIAQLSPYGVLETYMEVPQNEIYEYTITSDQFQMLNGSGTGRDINFISDINQALILTRGRRQYINNSLTNATFTGKIFTDDNQLLDVLLYFPTNTTLRIESGTGGNVVSKGKLEFI